MLPSSKKLFFLPALPPLPSLPEHLLYEKRIKKVPHSFFEYWIFQNFTDRIFPPNLNFCPASLKLTLQKHIIKLCSKMTFQYTTGRELGRKGQWLRAVLWSLLIILSLCFRLSYLAASWGGTTASGCPVIVIDNIILVFRLSYLAASWGGKHNGFGLSYDCCW